MQMRISIAADTVREMMGMQWAIDFGAVMQTAFPEYDSNPSAAVLAKETGLNGFIAARQPDKQLDCLEVVEGNANLTLAFAEIGKRSVAFDINPHEPGGIATAIGFRAIVVALRFLKRDGILWLGDFRSDDGEDCDSCDSMEARASQSDDEVLLSKQDIPFRLALLMQLARLSDIDYVFFVADDGSHLPKVLHAALMATGAELGTFTIDTPQGSRDRLAWTTSVSYTHLTLPTSDLV